jgi:hypothetical protein
VTKETEGKGEVIEDENDAGIKLFANSNRPLVSLEKTEEMEQQTKFRERPDLLAHRKIIHSDQEFRNIAVSPEWVLEQQGVYKGPVENDKSKVITEM